MQNLRIKSALGCIGAGKLYLISLGIDWTCGFAANFCRGQIFEAQIWGYS